MSEDDDIPIHIVTDDEQRAHFAAFPPGTDIVQREVTMPSIHETECNARHERCETSRKAQGRTLWGIALALFSGLITVTIWGADKISSNAERAGETKSDLRSLQKQIDDVIIRVNKFAVVDPRALSIVQADIAPPATCGAGCTVSQDCSDVFSQCRYCYQGKCSSILPAEPPN